VPGETVTADRRLPRPAFVGPDDDDLVVAGGRVGQATSMRTSKEPKLL